MSRFRCAVFSCVGAVLLCAVSLRAPADNQAVLGWTGGATGFSQNLTVGWEFTLSQAVSVTHLGLWDYGSDGLQESHHVTIWNADGSKALADATVGSGGIGGQAWQWQPLASPVLLGSGTYVIGAHYLSPSGVYDQQRIRATSLSTSPVVTYVRSRSPQTTGDVFPPNTDSFAEIGSFGPNFMFRDPDAVPEPALIQLPLLLGFGGAGFWLRRRRS